MAAGWFKAVRRLLIMVFMKDHSFLFSEGC